MTRNEAVAKARKLLSLARSDNEHEAALAAAAAERVLARYGLGLDAVDGGEPAPPAEPDAGEECRAWEEPLYHAGDTWRGVLARGVAEAHGVVAYRNGDRIYLIGRASNVAAVRYLAGWMAREVERLADARRGNGRAWLNAYRHGAVAAILRAVREARGLVEREARERAAGTRALVVVERAIARPAERLAEAQDVGRRALGLRGGGRRVRVNSPGGYAAGFADGARVYNGGGRPALGAGQRAIRG